MNMETQCTPSRLSLMTGRWSIRSGTNQVPYGGMADPTFRHKPLRAKARRPIFPERKQKQ